MIVLNSLFPIFVLVVLGSVLKRFDLTSDAYLKTSDKLVYYIFFPVLLFWKIGGASYSSAIDWRFCFAVLLALLMMFVISTIVINLGSISRFKAGSFSQCCYRFNTYIGVAVILNSLGEEGVASFGVLIAIVIPLINVFAVSVLIWFSGEEVALSKRVRAALRALVANPLIIGCLTGLVYGRLVGYFPVFVDNSLHLMSMVTLPLALLSVGGSLSFKGLQRHLPLSLLAALLKLVVLPISGFVIFKSFEVTGISFKVGMIFFCLPASTSIYVLSSQLNSDTELAASAIVVSTILSFISLSIALLL
ncbi:MAG: AEC family transporter [Proteobacteria bacterium]|nr:AEC family transporter [Pseudomonadota bacterium]MBU1057747.1 AEC family transporter [Pseudomonadota bacterium]